MRSLFSSSAFGVLVAVYRVLDGLPESWMSVTIWCNCGSNAVPRRMVEAKRISLPPDV
jgi:hypothetical protein